MLKAVVNVVSGCIMVLMLFLALAVPLFPLHSCKVSEGSKSFEPTNDDYYIWVVADPQIVGSRRNSVHHYLNNKMNDMYYEFVTTVMWAIHGPFDLTIMLGDLMSFQYYGDAEFYDIHARFEDSFSIATERMVSLAGNHDVGYGSEMDKETVDRFEKTFNKRHWVKKLNGVWLVGCDGMELDGSRRTESWKFLNSFIKNDIPIVLFTHIPLWKPAGSCPGDKPEIRYTDRTSSLVHTQTTLSQNTTKWILENVKPIAVLSGHDHEGCTYQHPTAPRTPEWTLQAIQGDHSGNTGMLSWSPETQAISLQQCTSFTTKTILVGLIALPILLVVIMLLSCVVMFRSRKVKSD